MPRRLPNGYALMGVESIKVSPQLALVLNRAGDKSGVDFDYLLQTAVRESSLNPNAKASTSSATGLFQFIENTWLDVMKSDGSRLGYQRYADAISADGQGNYSVGNGQLKAEILELRKDPAIAADLAAAFTRRNGEYLTNRFGRMPNAGELYIAHFLGAQGAARLFVAGLENPDQIAADLFPSQARANRAIFYSGGEARTIRDVYKALVAKHAPGNGAEPAQSVLPATSFAAQQAMANDPLDGRLVPYELPEVSFKSMFSNEGQTTGGSAPGGGNAGFFAQLYAK